MAPTAGAEAAKPAALARSGTQGEKAKGKQPVANKDVQYLKDIETGTTSKEQIKKTINFLKSSVENSDMNVLGAALEACVKICDSTKGFTIFFKHAGIETIMEILKEPPKDKPTVRVLKQAVKEACKAATAYFAEMDYVNFKDMGNFVYISCWLVGEDENLSLEVMDLIHRSALLRIENAVALIQGGAFAIMHKIIASHRSALLRIENAVALIQGGAFAIMHKIIASHRPPELVEEALSILCRLCDLPAEACEEYMVPFLLLEKEMVLTVVESLGHAPLNMRLQLSGMRLLAIWARQPSHEVRALIRKAKPAPILEGTVEKLSRAGFAHTAAWVSAVATRPLEIALDPEEQKLAKLAGVEG